MALRPILLAELLHRSSRSFPVHRSLACAGASHSHEHGHGRNVSVGLIVHHRMYHKQLLQHSEILKDRESALQFMKRNIVFNKDGIIALNKPPGMAVSGKEEAEEDEASHVSISSLLSELAELTENPALEIARGIEKESSGLVLFGENREVAEELTSKIHKARNTRQFILSYKAIVSGIPAEREGTIKLYLSSDVINGQRLTTVKHDPSRTQIKEGQVKSAETKYRVLSESKGNRCALVELQPLRVRRHQLQVQMIHKLCSMLGDPLYSHQIHTILGVPMRMDPYKVPNHDIQVLYPAIRKALAVTNLQVARLPLFLHLHCITLPEWRGRRDVELVAPYQAHFTRALKELGLKTDGGLDGETLKIEGGR